MGHHATCVNRITKSHLPVTVTTEHKPTKATASVLRIVTDRQTDVKRKMMITRT